MNPSPQPCDRCGQPTRYFWLADSEGKFLPWCNFCVAAQVLGFIQSGPVRGLLASFARAIDSGAPEDIRAVSLALRGLATLLRDSSAGQPPPVPE